MLVVLRAAVLVLRIPPAPGSPAPAPATPPPAMTKWVVVSRTNYAALLPRVLDDIRECDFVAFDCEFTGLLAARASRYSALDDVAARYAKLRDSATAFGLLQLGLSCFRWDQARARWAITAYSFHVLPAASNALQQERRFACQLGSLAFLAQWGFDFNKSFHHGIPFISLREEATLRSNATERQSTTSPSPSTSPALTLNAEPRLWMDGLCPAIDAWPPATPELVLPPMNSFQRLLVYQQLPLRYPPDAFSISKRQGGPGCTAGCLALRRISADPGARATALAEEQRQLDRHLEDQIGFRRVLDAVIQHRKPIVGHNCWLDLCHLFQKFIDAQMPLQADDFKASLLAHFPLILDTKFLAKSAAGLEHTHLSDLAKMTADWLSLHYPQGPDEASGCLPAVDPEPAVLPLPFYFKKAPVPGEDDAAVCADDKFHDAGFDSICTGQAFIVLLEAHLKKSVIDGHDRFTAAINDPALVNRLHIMQSDYDCCWLAGADDHPDRSHVLHVSHLPPNTPSSDLQAAWHRTLDVPAGSVPMSLAWINDQACFVQLESGEMAKSLLDALASPSAAPFKALAPNARIVSFDEYRLLRDQEFLEQSEQRKRPRRQ